MRTTKQLALKTGTIGFPASEPSQQFRLSLGLMVICTGSRPGLGLHSHLLSQGTSPGVIAHY